MAVRVRMELVPAPAITAGMVNTPVPMMLPMTSAVAEGSPRLLADAPSGLAEVPDRPTSVGVTVVVMDPSLKGVPERDRPGRLQGPPRRERRVGPEGWGPRDL